MPPRPSRKKRKAPPAKPLDMIPCQIHVSRGGITIVVDRIAASQAAELASHLLQQIESQQHRHPELARPQEYVQLGGYSPVDTSDDDTWARAPVPSRIGFSAESASPAATPPPKMRA